MFFLNQEINPATISNPESKSKLRIKEHEHQTYREKKIMNITKSKNIVKPSKSNQKTNPNKPNKKT